MANVPLSHKDIALRAGAAFRAVQSPRFERALKVALAGTAIAFAYTAVLATANHGFWMTWIEATRPIADAVASAVPSIRLLAAELVRRGLAARAAYVGHVIASQWLILGFFFAVAGIMLVPERLRLRRGLDAYRREKSALGAAGPTWVTLLLWLLMAGLLVWIPLDGHSRQLGRPGAYDLATDWGGLFLLLTTCVVWWCIVLYLWSRALAATVHREASAPADKR
jgi:hypothetical protein